MEKMIKDMKKCGIFVSCGHDDGRIESLSRAIDAGVTNCTHWYCAMSTAQVLDGVRSIGMMELALIDDRLSIEIIADMFHITPHLAKMASVLNIYSILKNITKPFSIVAFLIIIMIPLVMVLVNYKTTYIRYKKFCLNLSVITLSLIVFFEILTFFFLPTRIFCSFNLDSYSYPVEIFNEYSGFYNVSITPKLIIFMMITLNTALLACLIMSYTKPFKFFIHSDLINIKALKKLDNNILMMFHTYKNAFWGISKLSEQSLMYPDSAKDNLTAINHSSTEMFNGICRSIKMLSFSRDSIDTVDLIACIRNVIASNDIGNISFDIKTQYDAVYIKINEGHIMDILQNIVQNSIDAINSKGNNDGEITFKLYCEPGSVELQITDNGCGIKNSQIKNLFSYFNSTKHGNQHFGIGLIFIKKVIKAYNGHISIKSVYGKYTTVTLLFPLPTKE